jgi:hypothetical protein
MLSGVINRPCLSDHRHANLTRIGKLLFDALDHLVGNRARLFVVDLIRANQDAYLSAGLHGVNLLDAFESECNLLQIFQSAKMGLALVPTCARSCGADRIRNLHNRSLTRGAAFRARLTRERRTKFGCAKVTEEQRDREHWLSSMKLRAQDAAQRQDEIDNFQEGRTKICIFTLKAGGVGVDLDQQIETVRPRTMFATICWSGREFVQAFGRCKREFTLTNVYQHAVFFRNTIVADRIAPRLSSKLASINKLGASGIDLEGELLDAIDKAGPAETIDTSVVEDADTVIDDNDFDPEDL